MINVPTREIELRLFLIGLEFKHFNQPPAVFQRDGFAVRLGLGSAGRGDDFMMLVAIRGRVESSGKVFGGSHFRFEFETRANGRESGVIKLLSGDFGEAFGVVIR